MSKKTTYHFIAFALFIYLCSSVAAQTNKIGGVVNQYAKVTKIEGKEVTLFSLSEAEAMFGNSFSSERQDTVLLIQMTGIPETGNVCWGAGRYEFHIVTNVIESTVTLRSEINQSDATFQFDPEHEIVQMIRVRSYKNALINRELTCDPFNWNDGKGGVLALFVQDSLIFDADINVSERGFNGGESYNPTTTLNCIPPSSSHANLLLTSELAGKKGEGVIEKRIYDSIPKGYARTWNGGGGGIGKWSGGGGGANASHGGSGGNQQCGYPGWLLSYGGNYGNSIKYNDIPNISKLSISNFAYMGGGGGAGTGVNGTNGGNGGGIVIIVAQNMIFSDDTWIKSVGGSVAEAPEEAGAGGGGGGGSILLSVKNYGRIKVDISGGNGGNVYSESTRCEDANKGVGGGGSGGFLFTSEKDTNRSWYKNKDSVKMSFGTHGNIISSTIHGCSGNQQDGSFGDPIAGFKVQLRGFLHNYIFTPETVCYDEPVTISASDPLGGTDHYSYEWFYSFNGIKWYMINDANQRDLVYRFTNDIWLQRKVTSGDVIDMGLPIKIKVHDPILNQIIENDIFCREDQITVGGEKITGGGGNYTYQWEELTGETWGTVNHTINDEAEELSLILTQNPSTVLTNQYRRTVTSGAGCIHISNTSTIIIHPSIEGNNIDGDMEECEDISLILTASMPTGGDGSNYRFVWQIKEGDHNWIDAPGVNDKKDYSPGIANKDREFRRSVESGKCKNDSEPVKVRSKLLIKILPQPPVLNIQFNIDLNAIIPEQGRALWSSSNNNLKFSPDPPDKPNVKVENMRQGVYIFKLTVENGKCVSEDSIMITVIDIFFPKGFSPNGDDYNNCFRIKGAENTTLSKIVIFDRYNNIVFEDDTFGFEEDEFGKKRNCNYENNKDCTCWWDGSDKRGNDLPSGVYYYRYTYRLEGDMYENIKNGYVVLRR